jgi:lipoprotein-releasing system permease protein
MSRLPFELLLALRYLRPKRTFVSVITLISVLGVLLGVAVLIVVISVMSGFDHDLRERILGFNTHVQVLRRGESMSNYAAVAATVAKNPRVRGVSPAIIGPVLIETQPTEGEPLNDTPLLRGIEPETEGSVSVLPTSVVRGKFDVSGHGLLVGTSLAAKLGLKVGDRVAVHSAPNLRKMYQAHREGKSLAIKPEDFEVRGIFDVGFFEFNSTIIVTSLAQAQELYGLDETDSVQALLVMLHDPYQAVVVRRELEAALGPDFETRIWMEENSMLLDALAVEKNVMFVVLTFIMVVAALCIMSALITFVVQKTREIGMLKAIGATRWQIGCLFLGQSAAIGFIGVALGYGTGLLLLAYRNEFLHFMRRLTGFELFPESIYMFSDLPALIVGPDIALICASSFLICLLGGVIPAWSAGRLRPVEALRYE